MGVERIDYSSDEEYQQALYWEEEAFRKHMEEQAMMERLCEEQAAMMEQNKEKE